MTTVRRSKGPRPGGTDGERASGTTTKILSRWSGGYRDKYGCTRKGGGGGGGAERYTHQDEQGVSRASKDTSANSGRYGETH